MNGTLTDRLKGTRLVHFDAAIFIYFIEKNPRYVSHLRPVFELTAASKLEAMSSMLTLTEVMVHPLRRGERELAREYRDLLQQARGFRLVEVSRDIAERAAEIRARRSSIRTPDAIQLATALCHGAKLFLSNDVRLGQCDEMEIVILDDWLDDGPKPP